MGVLRPVKTGIPDFPFGANLTFRGVDNSALDCTKSYSIGGNAGVTLPLRAAELFLQHMENCKAVITQGGLRRYAFK